jgi:hypothetical protein
MPKQLRAKVLAATVMAAALLAPGESSAASVVYKGVVAGDPDATVKINVKGNGNWVKSAKVRNLDATCDGGAAGEVDLLFNSSTLGAVNGRGKFKIDFGDGSSVNYIKGKLTRAGNARGKVEFDGDTDLSSGVRTCETGKQKWTASRT